jgi:predicted nucleotidyltransferase
MAGIEEFLKRAAEWAQSEIRVDALLLVGSHARGGATASSDVDLVILTESRAPLLRERGWAIAFGTVERLVEEDWGAVRSLRVRYANGLEVEFGLAGPDWLAEPLDPGTAEVVRRGYRLLFDRRGSLTIRLRNLVGPGNPQTRSPACVSPPSLPPVA